MSNEDILHENNQVSDYQERALQMLHPYKRHRKDLFHMWLNEFEYVADIIGIPDDKMVEFFENMVNNNIHTNVKTAFSTINFSKLSYDQIINHYLCYLVSSNLTNSYRKRFLCRNQYEQETIENYAKCLRKLINKCCCKTGLEERLCKQFINGIQNDEIRTFIKKHIGLSFDEMIAKAIEFGKNNLITDYVNQALSMIPAYDSKSKVKFYSWLNKFEYVADIVKVPDNKMVKFFNHMVDNDLHTKIRNINTDVNLSELSYDDTIKLYYRYFSSSRKVDFYTERFQCRYQYEEETIEKYANSLRKIYYKSSYENCEEDKLLEQFLNGIREEEIRTELQEFYGLSFDETVLVAADLAKLNNITTYVDKAVSMIHTFSLKREENFDEWLNKFEYVADIVDVPDNKMFKFFNEMVDKNVHTAVKKSFLPVKFSELSYEMIINHYLRYFSSSDKTDLHKRRFLCRNQYEKETIENYANRLRTIYNKCYYKHRREEKLCEYFIKGIRDDDLKNNLSKIFCTSFDAMVAKAIEFRNVIQINDFLTPALSMIQSYNPEKDGLFYKWLNKFEYVADTLRVPDFLMVEFFNNLVDNGVHKSVMRTYQSINFSELSYDEIIKYYLRYFPSSKATDLHRRRFLCRDQYEEETIENYADCLRKIYNKCNDTSRLEEELCEQFLNGIRDDEIKAYFKEVPRLSFDETVVVAANLAKCNEITSYVDKAVSMMHTFSLKREENFDEWLNKFEYVADIVEVPDNKMIKFFNEMVENDVHTTVKKFFLFVKFSELPYEKIINHYLRYFSSSNETDLHRKRFLCRNQYEEETIENYADCLRKIHNKCNDTSRLEEELCEQFLNGIRDDEIKAYFKEVPRLSFDKTVVVAANLAKCNEITSYVDKAVSMMHTFSLKREENFDEWLNKFEYVADIVEVPDNKMIKFFNKMVDNDVHTAVKKSFLSVNFSELPYEMIINNYLRYFSSPNETDLHRKRFLCRNQYEEETIENYANRLRKIYNKCCYTHRREERLCEYFIKGIRDDDLKNNLSKIPYTSFDATVAKAIGFTNVIQINDFLTPALSMIRCYNPGRDGLFYEWLNKFEYVADTLRVPDFFMVEFFNNLVDNGVHKSVMRAYQSINFSELSYDEIIKYYLRYFPSSNSTDLHRKRFLCRNQYEEETIENYADSLRKIYNKCNDTSRLEEVLCEQFRNGICDDEIKAYFKKVSRLSFDETVEVAADLAKLNEITTYVDKAVSMIHTFCLKKEENFDEWLNKFEYVADIVEVPDNKMIKFFNEMVDNDVHRAVKKSFLSVNFSELLYEMIINNYLRYFSSPNETDLHRKRFLCRNQYEEETNKNYADRLRKIYNKCCYTHRREERLCEYFIKGIRDDDLRNNLSKIPCTSFDAMVAKAIEFTNVIQINDFLTPALSMIQSYNPEKDGLFYEWLNKFEYVADTLRVPDFLMVEFFNNLVDNGVHESVMRAYQSINFSELSYDEIINHYLRYFSSSNETDLHRRRFFCRDQYKEETIEKFADCLRKIYNKCNDTSRLEEELCEYFIKGIRDYDLKNNLSKIPFTSFHAMVAKAIEFTNGIQINDFLTPALSMIQSYNPVEDGLFYKWLNKFEYVADTLRVPDFLMVEFFNKLVDNGVHKSVMWTYQSINFSELSYDEIIKYYLRYFPSSNSTDLHRKRFLCRNQYEEETIENYADCLRKIHNKCNDTSRLEEELCEQFLNGIRDEEIKAYFKEVPRLSFDETLIVATYLAKCSEKTTYVDKAFSMIHTFSLKREENFDEWLNKFEYVADIVEVPDNKMIKFFNEMVDNDVHTAVKKSFLSVKFSELPYEKIINHYLRYFSSFNETDLHRRRFLCRNQYEEETIENYANRLRKIFNKCYLKHRREEKLCENFIKGIRDDDLKNNLSKISCKSFDATVAKAIEFRNVIQINDFLTPALSMIQSYNPEKDGLFYKWLNKFEYVADTLRVPDFLIVEFFNKLMDNGVHKSVMRTYQSINFSELSYDEIINHYLRYYSSSDETDLHRRCFLCRNQYEEETIENYANRLRKIFNKCHFKRREEKLCEYFIKGIRDDDLRNNLSKISCTSFDETVAKAIEFTNVIQINDFLTPALSMIQSYNPEKDGLFYEWLNKFEYVADTLRIPDFLMVEFFNKLVDNGVHESVMRAYQSINFSELSYDEIIKYYLRYFSSSNETDLHRRCFLCRDQYEEETIENYADCLRKIYNKCNDTSRLEEELCEQFLNGIRDDEVKAFFKEVPRLSFDEMVLMVIAFKKDLTASQCY